MNLGISKLLRIMPALFRQLKDQKISYIFNSKGK